MKTNTPSHKRHGGAYDRGSADAWYRRTWTPHYYKEDTYNSELVEKEDMTPEQVEAYSAGFDDGMKRGEHKNYD